MSPKSLKVSRLDCVSFIVIPYLNTKVIS